MEHNTFIKKIKKIVRFRNIIFRKGFQRRVDELTKFGLKLAVEVAKHYTTVYLFSVSMLLSMMAILLAIMVANAAFNLLGLIFFDKVFVKWIYLTILISILIGSLYLGLKFELYNKLYLECLGKDNKRNEEENMP